MLSGAADGDPGPCTAEESVRRAGRGTGPPPPGRVGLTWAGCNVAATPVGYHLPGNAGPAREEEDVRRSPPGSVQRATWSDASNGEGMMGDDMRDLYQRAVESFGARVHAVGDDQWHLPPPCTEWAVHTLVNPLVYEMRWSVPLFAGGTIAEVGARFEGDLLGDDPNGAWDAAAEQAVTVVRDDGVMERTVHLSFGDVPAQEYAQQLHADLLIHGWDLARATGGGDRLDPGLGQACASGV